MGLCYTTKTTYINTAGDYKLDKKCNGYAAINIGDTIARVANTQIKPPILPTLSGESSGVIGNEGEVFTGNNGTISVIFIPGAGTVNPLVMIVEKYYV